MNDFLNDLWSDLREKRLWPVAALLLVALIAVPVMLSKPTEEPASVTVVAPEAKGPDVARAWRRSPWPRTRPARDPRSTCSIRATPSSRRRTSSPTPTSRLTRATGTGSTDTGTATERDAGEHGHGHRRHRRHHAPTPVETKTIEYRFVIDGGFTKNGKKKQFESLKTVGLLPNQLNPLLMYIGVGKNLDNAVFLVDTTLIPDADGDGKCKPSRAKCAFLYLGPGETQKFTTADGDTYKLRISQIRKVKVTDDESSDESPRTTATARRERARSRASTGSPRRFSPTW